MNKLRKIYRFLKGLIPKTPKLKFAYGWFFKHGKVKEHQVLFESFHGKDISDSSLAILNEFLKMEESSKYTIYFATNDKERDQKFIDSIGLDVKLVDILTFEYVKVLATSKYLINNSSFPAYFICRQEQIYLQTWHGTPLKTLGKKMRLGIESMYNVQHNFLHADYVMFPNEFTKEAIMRDYNLDSLYTGKVVMNGYPRNSIFMNEDRAIEIKKQLGNESYTTLAYMPTWRGQSNHDVNTDDYSVQVNRMLKYLDDSLKDHQKLYVNFHPMVQKSVKLDNYQHIYPFPYGVDKYEFLNSVDALITDYSSVFFDYSITRKPIILYIYDYDEYMYDRGMYFDIKELPFRQIFELEELRDCIVEEQFRNDDYSQNQDYIQKYIQYDSIDAGKKMAELVFHGKEEGLPIIDYSHNAKETRDVVFYPEVNNTETLDALARTVDPKKDIVLFEKRYFNPELSAYLHDNYADDFDYIFMTRTLPRTPLEDLRKKKNAQVKKELHQREIKRLFAGLKVNPKFKKTYYHGEAGETYYWPKAKNLKATMEVKDGELWISYDENDDLTKILITNYYGRILWTRLLTEEEKKNHIIKEDFHGVLESGMAKERLRYMIVVEKEENGVKVPCFLKDTKEFKKRKETWDEFDPTSVFYEEIPYEYAKYRDEEDEKQSAAIPFMHQDSGRFAVYLGTKELLYTKILRGKVEKFKIQGSKVHLVLRTKKQENPIKDIVLSYRSEVENIEYSFDYTIQEDGSFLVITASIDMAKIELQELFWDVNIVTEKNGVVIPVSSYWTRVQRFKLLLNNYECRADEEHIIFPYSTIGTKIAFTYRQKSKYDGMDTKIKELVAFGLYTILLPFWKKKRIWLVFEKFCSMAQDNGYYFFKYCMEDLSKEESKHIYYILDKDSADWDKMKAYGAHVIPFMSVKHILYALAANLYVGSDSKKHLYAWRAKPNVISNRISKHNILFLQHGVTALKQVNGIFGKTGSSPMTHFTTTSKFEQEIITANFGYEATDAPILGFTRWDVLEDTSKKDEKIILAMPTWRAWLEEKSAEEFKHSDYYNNYMRLLQSEKLAKMLKENQDTLIFYIHPKFKDYLSEFNVSGDNIQLIPFGSEPLNEIMKKCSMLITDYSSVCWDVYYLNKPVLFYQFDYDMYMQAHGSYIDMEHDLFGERYVEYEQLMNGIEKYIQNGFQIQEKDTEQLDYYFGYRDNHNSKRTYEYIIGKGY